MAMLLTASTTVMADDYAYLNVTQTDGGENSFTVSKISKITFSPTNMIITLSDGTTSELPLASLNKMFFTDESTGIASLTTSGSQISLNDGTLHVNAPRGSVVSLYNMEGKMLRTVTAQGEDTQISVSGLTKGVYIVKVGNNAKKIMNK